MRIGLVIYGSLRNLSGGFLYDRMLADHLTAAGHRVIVFTLPWHSYPRHLLDNLGTDLVDRIGKTSLDLLLQDELNHPSLIITNQRLKRIAGCPMVSIVHHLRCMEPRSFMANALYRTIERAYLQTLDGFVFNSRYTRKTVTALTGLNRPQVVATPGGDRLGALDDHQVLQDRCLRPGPLKLLFIGNVIRRKNLHGLLSVLQRLKGCDWQLNVIGNLAVESSYTDFIKNQIGSSGLAERVHLCGIVDDGKLRQYLHSHHLLTMPFAYEGFGIAYLEGMAFGLPALACRQGGASELVRHGETGYLFNPNDFEPLAAVMNRLNDHRNELLQLSLAARRRFDAFPNWRDTTRRIRGFLETMA